MRNKGKVAVVTGAGTGVDGNLSFVHRLLRWPMLQLRDDGRETCIARVLLRENGIFTETMFEAINRSADCARTCSFIEPD